ncbi:hypothetical protein AAG906_015444 [Vitis piasezkii]
MRFEMKGLQPEVTPDPSDALLINGQPGDLYPCSKSVVGTDGSYTKPLTRDFITIFPGQTYDVLLEANQRPDHYYMAAITYSFYYATTDTTLHLRLHPSLFFLHTMTQMHRFGANGTRFSSSINNISFDTPTVDILQAYYYNISEVRVLEYNSTVEIVFQGTNVLAATHHPMHLHGYSFYVVGWGFGNFDGNKDPLRYNLVDPPFQNTISVPSNGWVAIRFEASNPVRCNVGIFSHCECGSCTAM